MLIRSQSMAIHFVKFALSTNEPVATYQRSLVHPLLASDVDTNRLTDDTTFYSDVQYDRSLMGPDATL